MREKQKIGMLAGAAAAAVAAPAQASIIYTPASLTVNNSTSQDIDFNQDGSVEVNLDAANSNSLNLNKPTSENKQDYVADPSNAGYVAALPAGETIDSTGFYGKVGQEDKTTGTKNTPPLVTVTNGTTTGGFTPAAGEQFIGMQLTFTDGYHYAWIGFQTTSAVDGDMSGDMSGTITGYAYETDVDTAITAGETPEPSSLALLALGAAGLARYRGRNRQR